MKYIVASDIHGSIYWLNKLLEKANSIKPDKIILLGDLYYHGPRNTLPIEYNPMEVSRKLNNIKDQLIVIKGNCDALVDEMISDFKFLPYYEEVINNKKCYFTHGHEYNIDDIKNDVDVLIYGHFHTGFIKTLNKQVFINSGSITLPKNNTPHSYLVMEDNVITLFDFEDNVISEISI